MDGNGLQAPVKSDLLIRMIEFPVIIRGDRDHLLLYTINKDSLCSFLLTFSLSLSLPHSLTHTSGKLIKFAKRNTFDSIKTSLLTSWSYQVDWGRMREWERIIL